MDFEISYNIPPILSPDDWVAIDLELFGAERQKLHRPTTGTFACLSICAKSDLNTVYLLTSEDQVASALKNIRNAVWVFHNASFDITHLRRWTSILPRKKIWDVMIIERILSGGLFDTFSLEDIVRRRLDMRMNKEIRASFESKHSLTKEQLQYAANDAYVTMLACEAQKSVITKNDYKIWAEIDRGALWAILDFKGFCIDAEAWKNLAINNEKTAISIRENLSFNPASPAQVKKILIANGYKGLKDTQEKSLQRMINRFPDKPATELAKQVLEYRMISKRASTYGQNFLTNYLEIENGDPVIHAGYWVVGTETGRTASSNPNLQNIPIRETKDFRKCFIARPGYKLVVADMGQQETRIVAHLSQDPKLIKILQDKTQDIFVGMAKMMYRKNITKDDPFRKQVKNTTYGIIYGMSAKGMADRYNMTENDAETAISLFFNTFSGLYSWVSLQQKKKDCVSTIAGRKIWLNPYSDQVERNAVNSPIQGSAADQMKTALGNIHRKWNFPFEFSCVGYIHDELIFDVPEKFADKVGQFISKEMVAAAEMQCPDVPFIAEYKICDNWSEKE